MPKTPDYFHDKTIVITGAASGIGRATALIFAREGANVVCADIDAEGARRTAETAMQRGVRALGIATDVTRRQSVDEMVDRPSPHSAPSISPSSLPAARCARRRSPRSTMRCSTALST
jgi:FlaA1/EpsC-like NDP-sugar epimerase